MLKNEEDLLSIVAMLTKTDSWNPHAKFFIFVDIDLGANWEAVLKAFLRHLWREFVINVILMYPDVEHFIYKVCVFFINEKYSLRI